MGRTREKNTSTTCQAIRTRIDPNLQPLKSQLTYFINITINNKVEAPLAKLRIKIPKLVAKTVEKTQSSNNVVGGSGGGGGGGGGGCGGGGGGDDFKKSPSRGDAKQRRQQICRACKRRLSEEKEKFKGVSRLSAPLLSFLDFLDKRSTSLKNLCRRGRDKSSKDGRKANNNSGCDDDDNELCKKKIILGERCRPLDFSGPSVR